MAGRAATMLTLRALLAVSEPICWVIPGWLPDPCLTTNGRRRSHWTKVRKAQQQAQEAVGNVALAYGLHRLPRWERARVDIQFVHSTNRRRDIDNFYPAAKPVVDAIVLLGIVKDDDTAHLDLKVWPQYERGTTETRIRIEEVRDDDGDSA